MITIELVGYGNQMDLFHFEVRNRAYFQSIHLGRWAGYYEMDSFGEIVQDIIEDQLDRYRFLYVLRDRSGEIVGRVNLFNVEWGEMEVAEIGYRIGEHQQGKGYATKGVELVLKEAFGRHQLHRIIANAATSNSGSQKVLEKNGFYKIGVARDYIKEGGRWIDSILYDKLENR